MGEPTAPGKAKLKFTGLRDFALQHFCVGYRPIHLSQSQSAFYITATCTISADKLLKAPHSVSRDAGILFAGAPTTNLILAGSPLRLTHRPPPCFPQAGRRSP